MVKSDIDIKDFKKLMKQLTDLPNLVMKKAKPEAKKNTPKNKGYARTHTNLRGKNTIYSNYDYAGRLDDGWSKQAPKGFTDPTIDFIEDEIARQLSRID